MNGPMMKSGLSFLKNIDFASFLDGASKTLSVVNQAIPVYNQVKPIISNFHLLRNIQSSIVEDEKEETHNSPIFYL